MSGPYEGFTAEEMRTEWERYKAELTQSGTRLTGSSVNGDSYQFGPRADWSLAEWGKQVRLALAQVDPDFKAPGSTIRAHFDCE